MKSVFSHASRFRVALALALTLAFLPLGSVWNVSEAKPPRHAPAYGYRRKTQTKRVYRTYKRPVRREYRNRSSFVRSRRDSRYRTNKYRSNRTRRTDHRDRDDRR